MQSGINNIYRVEGDDNKLYECRIKGKILDAVTESYNPLAPGDRIDFQVLGDNKGLVLKRLQRSNEFGRWNRKRGVWQTFAANLDLLLIVISASNPPPRPRFVDRVLINAAQGGVPAAILVNKIDLGWEWDITDRLIAWEMLGVKVGLCSAVDSTGLDDVQNLCTGKTVAFFGSSGVGKTSLLNRLAPGSNMPTREISRKYRRGRHVTNSGRLLKTSRGTRLIDTPGIREIMIHGISPDSLVSFFDDLQEPARECFFSGCSHIHEKSCAVKSAVAKGIIHADRYESYVRIRNELESRESCWA